MTEYVNPLYIHTGMLAWIEVDHPKQKCISIPVEITAIKEDKGTVEVTVLAERVCFWININEVLVKVTGHPSVAILKESKFHNLLTITKKE